METAQPEQEPQATIADVAGGIQEAPGVDEPAKPKRHTTTLADYEITLAAHVAVKRQVQNIMNGAQQRYGAEKGQDDWGKAIVGCLGELVVAKYLNIFWNGAVGDYKADDVGKYQVRTTCRDDGRLIMHDDDKDDRPYIHVILQLPRAKIMGWMLGRDAKNRDFFEKGQNGNRPAYFVPNELLRPMLELPK